MGRILPTGLRVFPRPFVRPCVCVCVFVPRFVVYRAMERYYVYTVGAFCFWPSVTVLLSQKPQVLELFMLTRHGIWNFLHNYFSTLEDCRRPRPPPPPLPPPLPHLTIVPEKKSISTTTLSTREGVSLPRFSSWTSRAWATLERTMEGWTRGKARFSATSGSGKTSGWSSISSTAGDSKQNKNTHTDTHKRGHTQTWQHMLVLQ